jgi:hypothetical protein
MPQKFWRSQARQMPGLRCPRLSSGPPDLMKVRPASAVKARAGVVVVAAAGVAAAVTAHAKTARLPINLLPIHLRRTSLNPKPVEIQWQ